MDKHMNCLSSFIYCMVRLCDLVPSFLHPRYCTWCQHKDLVGRASSWCCMDGMANTESVAHRREQRPWGKLQQSEHGWYFNARRGSNGCTLRLCAVVRLSIAPVDDVGSTKIIWTLGTECSPLTLHEPHGRQTTMLAHQWRLLRFWCSYLQKGRRRRKHIRKNTWSVTMVVFVRKGRQDWRQPAITSENSYSFMIFDSQQLQGKFWLSRTLPSNFFFDNMNWKNREWKAEGKWRQHSIWKKETRDTNLDISWLQANLAVLDTRGEHKERTKTNELLEKDGHGIAGRLDVSNTAKIQAKVAGHQFRLECCCYSGRTASCWVWTWNHTGAVPS